MRTRAFRKNQEKRIITKKTKIVRNVFHYSNEDFSRNVLWKYPHRFSKNIVHCSCPMCSRKTKELGWKHSDKVNLQKGCSD